MAGRIQSSCAAGYLTITCLLLCASTVVSRFTAAESERCLRDSLGPISSGWVVMCHASRLACRCIREQHGRAAITGMHHAANGVLPQACHRACMGVRVSCMQLHAAVHRLHGNCRCSGSGALPRDSLTSALRRCLVDPSTSQQNQRGK